MTEYEDLSGLRKLWGRWVGWEYKHMTSDFSVCSILDISRWTQGDYLHFPVHNCLIKHSCEISQIRELVCGVYYQQVHTSQQ